MRTIIAWLFVMPALATAQHGGVANDVEITILSSNLASGGTIGEWGFSALAKIDDQCVLFDTGNYPETVLKNARVLGTDLACVTDIVLSHFHPDHMGGLVTLFEHVREANPHGVQRIHVAKGFFLSRRIPARGDREWNSMIKVRGQLEAEGVEFKIYSEATEVLPSVWVTGPVRRTHDEKTYPEMVEVNLDGDWVVDFVPDSQGMTIVTPEGPIVLLGCGHSGSVNLLEQVQRDIQDHSIYALMGGMHLYAASEVTLDWTARQLTNIGVQNLMAGHCTGVEPLFQLRDGLNLTRKTAVIGAVGSKFVLGEGIHPTAIAQ